MVFPKPLLVVEIILQVKIVADKLKLGKSIPSLASPSNVTLCYYQAAYRMA